LADCQQVAVNCQQHGDNPPPEEKRREDEEKMKGKSEGETLTASPAAKAAAKLSDEEWIKTLPTHFPKIDTASELRKMDAWISINPKRKKTKKFILTWLNKIDTPIAESEPALPSCYYNELK
jgi:hypothetical protein